MTASTTPIARRLLLALLTLVAMPAAWAFGLDDVAMRANSLASKAYQPPVINMPAALRDLDYDGYRDIRFRPEKALWRADKLPFELMFFHQGRTVPEAGAHQHRRSFRKPRGAVRPGAFRLR